MPAQRKLPDVRTLKRWSDDGLSHQQIADRWELFSGQKVARSTVSTALHRAGATASAPRYRDCLPWRVRERHLRETPARMLRFLGRQRAGSTLAKRDSTTLRKWLLTIEERGLVVGYDPDNELQGFHYVTRRPGDGVDGIPIRRGILRMTTSEPTVTPAPDPHERPVEDYAAPPR